MPEAKQSFGYPDFLAIESPPPPPRNHSQSSEKMTIAKSEQRRRSFATLNPSEKVQSIDITKKAGRVVLRDASFFRKTTSASPNSHGKQSGSVKTPRSPGSYRSFHEALLAKVKGKEREESGEFTADTHREEPYEYMKYKKPLPGMASHAVRKYKLVQRTQSANVSPSATPRKHAPKDLINLLKQALDNDSVIHSKSHAVAVVKQLQLTPQGSPSPQRPRKVLTRSQAMGTMVTAKTRNAFVIQPTAESAPTPDLENRPKSRAERVWQWKGKNGRIVS